MSNEAFVKLNIDSAIGITSLSKEAREDFQAFIDEYRYYYSVINSKNEMLKRDFKYNFNIDDFISFCSIKLGDIKDVKIKSPLRVYYLSLINHHKIFLSEMLKHKDKFYNLLRNIHNDYDFECDNINCYGFINYLKSLDEDNISKILLNLFELKKRGIFNIIFDENLILDGNYAISVVKNTNEFKDNKKRYMVIGTLCDGERDNYNKLGDDTYTFDAKDVKFVIKFSKGTQNNFDINFVCNDMLFDNKLLPSYQELHDTEVVPNIDYKKIDIECMYADIINLYGNAIKYLNEYDASIDSLNLELKENNLIKQSLELLRNRIDTDILYYILTNGRKEIEDKLNKMMGDKAKKLIKIRGIEQKKQEKYLD